MALPMDDRSPLVYSQVDVDEAFACLGPIATQLKAGKSIHEIDFGREITVFEKVRICQVVERLFAMADLLKNGGTTIEIPEWMTSGGVH